MTSFLDRWQLVHACDNAQYRGQDVGVLDSNGSRQDMHKSLSIGQSTPTQPRVEILVAVHQKYAWENNGLPTGEDCLLKNHPIITELVCFLGVPLRV